MKTSVVQYKVEGQNRSIQNYEYCVLRHWPNRLVLCLYPGGERLMGNGD